MKSSTLPAKTGPLASIRHSSLVISPAAVPAVDQVTVKKTPGDDWRTPERSRFGASTLVNDVPRQIARQVDGNHQGADYFSLA